MTNTIGTKPFKIKDNTTAVALGLLQTFDIPATPGRIDRTLKEHPDHPSLLSLADTLREWGMQTEGVTGNTEDLSDSDYPGIIIPKIGKSYYQYALLEGIENDSVTIHEYPHNRRTLSLKQFGDMWSGMLLRARPKPGAGERDLERNRKQARLFLARRLISATGLPLLFLAMLAFGFTRTGYSEILIPLSLVKIIGFILCAIMTAATLGNAHLLQSLCPLGRVVNCDRVLRSPAGKLLGVSMAEWGLMYFGGSLASLLAALYMGQFPNDLFLLGLLGCLTLPYTLFSIIYQAAIIRSWCWMCLVIQGLFWLEFALLYDTIIPNLGSELAGAKFPVSIVFGFGATILGWISLKPIIRSAKSAEESESQATRMRRVPEYIQYLLSAAEKIDLGNLPFEIILGPRQAKHTITAIVNPLCGHCSKAFGQLEHIMMLAAGQVNVAVRFLVTPNRETETPTEFEEFIDRAVSLRILSFAKNGNGDSAQKAIHGWFSAGKPPTRARYNRWQQEFSPNGSGFGNDRDMEPILNRHVKWALENNIGGTPTLFFNDRLLPAGLQPIDLKLFIMRLSDV